MSLVYLLWKVVSRDQLKDKARQLVVLKQFGMRSSKITCTVTPLCLPNVNKVKDKENKWKKHQIKQTPQVKKHPFPPSNAEVRWRPHFTKIPIPLVILKIINDWMGEKLERNSKQKMFSKMVDFCISEVNLQIQERKELLWSKIFRNYVFKKAKFWQAKVKSHSMNERQSILQGTPLSFCLETFLSSTCSVHVCVVLATLAYNPPRQIQGR